MKKRYSSSIRNCLTKVNFEEEIFLSPINSPGISPPKLSRVFPLAKCKKKKTFFFSLPLLASYTRTPPKQTKPPGFSSPLAPKSPPSALEITLPHYLSCIHKAGSLPSFFSLLHHQESMWIHGGLQGTQTKA